MFKRHVMLKCVLAALTMVAVVLTFCGAKYGASTAIASSWFALVVTKGWLVYALWLMLRPRYE